MTRQQKIDKIYSVIADKTLSFGCKFYNHSTIMTITQMRKEPIAKRETGRQTWYDRESKQEVGGHREKIRYEVDIRGIGNGLSGHIWEDEIIGHQVMIGDVLDWIEKNIGDDDSTIHNPNTLELYSKPSMEKGYKHYDGDRYIPVNDWSIYAMGLTDALADHIRHEREDLRKPIEDQSDECIDFIYGLLP